MTLCSHNTFSFETEKYAYKYTIQIFIRDKKIKVREIDAKNMQKRKISGLKKIKFRSAQTTCKKEVSEKCAHPVDAA